MGYAPKSTNCRFHSKTGVYKNSSGTFQFNPATAECLSYEWYAISRQFKGKLIFNNYRYSNTTNKHIIKCRQLLEDHGFKPWLVVEDCNGLKDITQLITDYEGQIKRLLFYINSPRLRKTTKENMVISINQKYEIIKKLKTIK